MNDKQDFEPISRTVLLVISRTAKKLQQGTNVHRMKMKRCNTLGILAVAVCLSLGCGGSDLPLVQVRGQVTFDGGPAPHPGKISFVPVRDSGISGMPNRPGWAQFGEDGMYEATSYKPGDGLLPGRYQVRISCLTSPPNAADPNWREKADLVPQDYRPPELLIEPGQGPIEVNYDVPPKNG